MLLNDEGTEWINEFKEGIELEPLDQVRILGSFVNEQAEGSEIEITDKMEFNVIHTPYILANTLATTKNNEDLMDLSSFSDLAFSTDATGIEPPIKSNPLKAITIPSAEYPDPPYSNHGTFHSVDFNDDTNYGNPTGTKEQVNTDGQGYSGNDNIGKAEGLNIRSTWFQQGSQSETFGTNLNTNDKYNLFGDNSVPNELYLSGLVKKFILPVADGFANRCNERNIGAMDNTYNLNTTRRPYEALNPNPPTTGAGRFSGVPKVGMCIATVNIAGVGGWFSTNGNGINEIYPIEQVGIPNLKGGVESVIGKIIAVRPMKYPVNGFLQDCFEIYVTDFINPATIKKGFYEHTFQPPLYREIGLGKPLFTPPTAPVTCKRPVHGSGQKVNGYNSNPAFNPLNGNYNQYKTEPHNTNANGGCVGGFTTQSGYPDNPFSKNGIRAGSDDTTTDGDTPYKYGMGQPWGLSFLWNGGDCATLRGATIPNTSMKANSYSIWYRDPPIGNPLDTAVQFYDVNTDNNVVGFGYEETLLTPQTMGAYIICKPETMLDIVMNGQDLQSEPNNVATNVGENVRLWWDYGFQADISDYKDRHYVNNVLLNTDTGGIPNNAPFQTTVNRFRYDMCGKPDNKNFIANNHNFGSTTPSGAGDGCTIFSVQNTEDVNMVSDSTPVVYSSTTGFRTWATGTGFSNEGSPFMWCGYNNCINSVHFQQKDCGSAFLSQGNTLYKTPTIAVANAGVVSHIDIHLNGMPTPQLRWACRIMTDTGTGTFSHLTLVVDFATDLGGGVHRIQFLYAGDEAINVSVGQSVWFTSNSLKWEEGCGVNAKPWASDLLMIKEYNTKIKIPQGYYTQEQLGATINDVLHYKTSKYDKTLGETNDGVLQTPTTVGKFSQNLGSQPTIINGNFVHTFIPEISYGFTPVTSENANAMNLTASTKDMMNELLTYDFDGTFYTENNLPAYNGTTVRYVYEPDTDGINHFGKHFKIYSIPYLAKNNAIDPEIHLIRLKGGSNLQGSLQPDGSWNITKAPRFSGWLEPLRGQKAETSATQGTATTYAYRTRGVRNIMPHGGGARIFCGANNVSVEFNELANRFNIFNLYTPIRPHASLNPSAPVGDFGIDDAVPSSVISARKTGEIMSALTGIYISSLTGDGIKRDEWGLSWADNWLYENRPDATIQQYANNFLDALGYSSNQLTSIEGNGIYYNETPYTYSDELVNFGNMLRGGGKITPAINGANPFANDCLMIAPVQQYFIATDSEDFFAKDPPTQGTSPYYFIASDLPIHHFMGNETGTKLPVVGINARNFHALGFSFDVGATSVTYTIDRKVTLTSIKTAIYDSNLQTPTNISKYSSVIYVVIKNNYLKTLPPDQQQEILKAQMKQQNPANNPLQYFQVPYSNLRTEPPVEIPQNYTQYQWNGSLLNPYEENSTDED